MAAAAIEEVLARAATLMRQEASALAGASRRNGLRPIRCAGKRAVTLIAG